MHIVYCIHCLDIGIFSCYYVTVIRIYDRKAVIKYYYYYYYYYYYLGCMPILASLGKSEVGNAFRHKLEFGDGVPLRPMFVIVIIIIICFTNHSQHRLCSSLRPPQL